MIVLSIDAWCNEEGVFDWNSWIVVAHISKEEFESLESHTDYVNWFILNGYIVGTYFDKVEINDDQYNIVIMDKTTQEPLFAIEYGCEY